MENRSFGIICSDYMEIETINKICLLPGVGTVIGIGTAAYNLPLALFKGGAISVGFLSNFLAQHQIFSEQTSDIRDWYTRRGPELKVELISCLRGVGVGLIRMLPVIGAV